MDRKQNSGESDSSSLEAESIRSRAEHMGDNHRNKMEQCPWYCGSFWIVCMDTGEPWGGKWGLGGRGLALYKQIHLPAKHQLLVSTTTAILTPHVVFTVTERCGLHLKYLSGVCVCARALATDPFLPSKTQQNTRNKDYLNLTLIAILTEKNKSSTNLISPNHMCHP